MRLKLSRLILPSVKDPYLNQALEEVLLNSVTRKQFNFILRFWRSKPCVIIGRNQSLKAEANVEFCKSHHIPIIRRITGGGAVYLDLGCLNFSIILSDKCTYFTPKVQILNEILIQVIIDALKSLHFNCIYKPPNSIFIGGKKISGSAQIFKRNSVLHHGTLLIKSDLNTLKISLKNDNKNKIVKYVQSNRTDQINLSSIQTNITAERIIQTMIKHIQNSFNVKLYNQIITNEEFNEACVLMKKRYLNINWQERIP